MTAPLARFEHSARLSGDPPRLEAAQPVHSNNSAYDETPRPAPLRLSQTVPEAVCSSQLQDSVATRLLQRTTDSSGLVPEAR
jgi:hypothetical protein